MHARPKVSDRFEPRGEFHVVCRAPDGTVKWEERFSNTVVNVGKDYILGAALSGAVQVTTHYNGLIDGATPTIAATDTMASHAGWAENTAYDEAARPTWTEAGVSGQSIDNSASPSTFTMNASATISGAFLTSDSTKGGTTGTLIAAGTFTGGDRSVQSADTLDVTYTINA